MTHLIDKSALVAEIDRRIAEYKDMKIDNSYYEGMVASLEFFRDEFINTIEVKEVDLDIEKRIKECPFRQVACNRYEDTPVICDGRCSWVADYPKLKELKSQKEE